jgi:hypothetical protein
MCRRIWKVAELDGFPVEQYMSAIRYLGLLARIVTDPGVAVQSR